MGSARGGPTATICNLNPQLRDVTINQGVGSYSPLVAGKETLARFYLSLPSCAASGASIQVTGASLTVSGATAGAAVPMTPTPLSTAYPAISTYSAAPVANSTGDPSFVIPGSAVAGATGFTASFGASVSYQSKTSSRANPVAGTATFSTQPGTTTPITAAFDRKTNPLRVLVVPMGDASKVYSTQFTSTAQAAVQDGMTATLSRDYPIAAGIAGLGTSGQGLQYTINPTLLDLRALGILDSSGKFCGTGANYNLVKGQLAQFLLSWNTANPAARADRVLGVIDPAIALGPPNPCFEGMAVLGSSEAWAQAITGRAGQLLGLELAHTLGLTPADRASPFDAGHSQTVTAENPPLGRRFNLVQRAYVATDRSLMKPSASSPSPDNNNTLFEAPDFAYARCVFGGTPVTECTSYPVATVGTTTAATLAFVMSGTTTGTAAGTNVVESYFSSSVPLTAPDSTSTYVLRQKTPGANIDRGVPVRFVNSEHAGSTSASEGTDVGLFSIAQAFDPNTTRVEFWKGTPGPGILLYARDRSDPPVITGIATGTGTSDGISGPSFRAPQANRVGSVRTLQILQPRTKHRRAPRALRRSPASVRSALSSSAALVTSFQVNSTADGPDSNVADGVCNDGSGSCTLRAAIEQANSTSGADTITFNINPGGAQTITPATRLPSITDSLTIEGTTQPGFASAPLIELDGTIASATDPPGSRSVVGLYVSAPDTTVRGVVINRFDLGGIAFASTRGRLEGSYIGTDPGGTIDRGNLGSGILLGGSANTIGGVTAAARNLISGNDQYGIDVGGSSNAIVGNYIGTTANGDAKLDNCYAGIDIQGSGNSIGGTSAGSRNVIAGNGGCGVTVAQIELRDNTTNNSIQGNYIGTNASASGLLGDTFGIEIGRTYNVPTTRPGPSNNTIGGTAAGAGNVIAGNAQNIVLYGTGTSGNTIQGNYIGTNASQQNLGSTGLGIVIFGATGNTIGGTAANTANVIAHLAGSNANGILVYSDSIANAIRGNSIYSNGGLGIDLVPTGDTPLGVTPNDAGDADTGANNLQNFPVLDSATSDTTSLTVTGTLDSANGTYSLDFFRNQVGASLAPGCDPSGNGEGQIYLGSKDVQISGGAASFTFSGSAVSRGDYITATATDSNGNTSEFSACQAVAGGGGSKTFTVTSAVDPGNGICDVGECTLREAINASNGNTGKDTIAFAIGTTGAATIQPTSALPAITDSAILDATTQPGFSTNTREPIIELNGSAASGGGLVLTAGDSTIRGFVVNRFSGIGIHVLGAAARGNLIAGNYLGTDQAGSANLGNGGDGVRIENASSNTVGGTALADRNLVSGNGGHGILMLGAAGNTVRGNFVGTNASGAAAIGNGIDGIAIDGGGSNTIGGTATGAGNLSSGNTNQGIALFSVGAPGGTSGNVIQGNVVGTNAAGTAPLPNGGQGVLLSNATNTTVGGTTAAAANLISGNGRNGVDVASGSGNSILRNAISANGSLGIDLRPSGITVNDPAPDGDSGANDLQNFPVVSSATPNGSSARVVGTLDSTPNASFRIDFYAEASCDSSGNGEGERWIGFAGATSDGNGRLAFDTGSGLTARAVAGEFVTATATSPGNSTSEFSACRQIASAAPPGQEPVFVTATDDHPTDLRLDLFLDCGNGKPKFPVAVGLQPSQTTATTASFSYNYDPSLACPNGTLQAVGYDGFSSSGFTPAGSATVNPGPDNPRVAISSPTSDQQFLTYGLIPLRGSARDSSGELADADLHWTLSGNGVTRTGTGHIVDFAQQWPAGQYTVTLTAARAGSTKTATTTATITVKTDADNDGLAADVEAQSCFTSGDNDPLNAFADYDLDGLVNVVDPQPCVAATSSTAIVDFNPDPLPTGSAGNTVTVSINVPGRNIAQVIGPSVRITRIADEDVSTDSRFQNIGWTINGGVGTAKFDRQKLVQYLASRNIHNKTISITVGGRSGAPPWNFEGSDATFVQG